MFKKIGLLLCVLFLVGITNITHGTFLEKTYVSIYIKSSDNRIMTGMLGNMKIDTNFVITTGFETQIKSFNPEGTPGGAFVPNNIDFYSGFSYRIDKIILSYKHSCFHFIDGNIKNNELSDYLKNRILPRNKVSIEF